MSFVSWWRRLWAGSPCPPAPSIPVLDDTTEYLPFRMHTVCPKCGSSQLARRFRKADKVVARERWSVGDVFPHVVAWTVKQDRLEVSCECGYGWTELPADADDAG